MILIGVNILLIAIALWSPLKWIKPTSWAMALSGLSILLLTEWLRKTIESLIHVTTITYRALTVPGIVLLISGIIIRFIYFVVAAIIKANKKDKPEKPKKPKPVKSKKLKKKKKDKKKEEELENDLS